MALVFETASAEGNKEKYQTVHVDGLSKPNIVNKPRKRRRFFWWLRWGQGKPHELDSYERQFQWRRDFQKPLKMLCYPHVGYSSWNTTCKQDTIIHNLGEPSAIVSILHSRLQVTAQAI